MAAAEPERLTSKDTTYWPWLSPGQVQRVISKRRAAVARWADRSVYRSRSRMFRKSKGRSRRWLQPQPISRRFPSSVPAEKTTRAGNGAGKTFQGVG